MTRIWINQNLPFNKLIQIQSTNLFKYKYSHYANTEVIINSINKLKNHTLKLVVSNYKYQYTKHSSKRKKIRHVRLKCALVNPFRGKELYVSVFVLQLFKRHETKFKTLILMVIFENLILRCTGTCFRLCRRHLTCFCDRFSYPLPSSPSLAYQRPLLLVQ